MLIQVCENVSQHVGSLTVDLELVLPLSRSGIVGGGAHVLPTVQRGDGGQQQQRSVLQDGHSGLPTRQFLAVPQPPDHRLRKA